MDDCRQVKKLKNSVPNVAASKLDRLFCRCPKRKHDLHMICFIFTSIKILVLFGKGKESCLC